jgi:hypothetical protein
MTPCDDGFVAFHVTFISNGGNLPLLVLDTTTGDVAATVVETTAGTTEDSVCNYRGNCGITMIG